MTSIIGTQVIEADLETDLQIENRKGVSRIMDYLKKFNVWGDMRSTLEKDWPDEN